jgi:hypothetical protein
MKPFGSTRAPVPFSKFKTSLPCKIRSLRNPMRSHGCSCSNRNREATFSISRGSAANTEKEITEMNATSFVRLIKIQFPPDPNGWSGRITLFGTTVLYTATTCAPDAYYPERRNRKRRSTPHSDSRTLSSKESVHLDTPGAFLDAQCIVAGLKGLSSTPMTPYLSYLGLQVTPANPSVPSAWSMPLPKN